MVSKINLRWSQNNILFIVGIPYHIGNNSLIILKQSLVYLCFMLLYIYIILFSLEIMTTASMHTDTSCIYSTHGLCIPRSCICIIPYAVCVTNIYVMIFMIMNIVWCKFSLTNSTLLGESRCTTNHRACRLFIINYIFLVNKLSRSVHCMFIILSFISIQLTCTTICPYFYAWYISLLLLAATDLY